jgi:hypothetical protein
LHAYLYPNGNAKPVTYLDARQIDGSPVDRVGCVSALQMKVRGEVIPARCSVTVR